MKGKAGKAKPFWGKVLLVCTVLLALLAIWQWDNLEALYLYRTRSGQELAAAVSQDSIDQKSVLDQYGKITVRDLTPEEESELVSGTITAEEVAKRLGEASAAAESQNSGENAAAASTKNSEVGEDSDSGSDSAGKDTQPGQTDGQDEIINRYLAQIYTLKAEFLGKLGNLYTAAKQEYYALPQKEQTSEKKRSIAMSYAWDAAADEGECDIAVDRLLKKMTADLKAIGAETDVVSAIKKAYQDQKAAKKAYYYSLLN